MYKMIIRDLGNLILRKFPSYAHAIRDALQKAGIKVLYELYLGRMVLYSFLVAVIVFFTVSLNLILILHQPTILSLIVAFVVSIVSCVVTLILYHYYPFQVIITKRNSIEGNMPFAVNHMAAIASSGVPPFVIFKLISNVPEYGQIMYEMKRVVSNIEVFGMDMVSGIKNVADRTPSDEFKEFLYSVLSNIQTGGDIRRFFDNYSRDAMLNYRLRREKYLKSLSTYADFYTAVLIAAPLFFISILSIMALIGGSVLGLDIATAMALGVYILIPVLNIIFILFLNYTQPVI